MGFAGNRECSKKTAGILILALMSIFLIRLTACDTMISDGALALSDVVYDTNSGSGGVVYIMEKGEYVPYIALSKKYNKNNSVLMLRQCLLSEKSIFTPPDAPAARYENSILDRYLENEFIQVFNEDFRQAIQLIDISTIQYDQLGKPNPQTAFIQRRVFSLSSTELGLSESVLEAAEGEKIPFFCDANSRIAFDENKEAGSWWTRTAHNWGGEQAVGIAPDGTAGNGSTSAMNGVRPAFCLPSDSKIAQRNDIVSGESVYALE